jgi:hypothetical protein
VCRAFSAAHPPRRPASGGGVAQTRTGRQPLLSRLSCDAFVPRTALKPTGSHRAMARK